MRVLDIDGSVHDLAWLQATYGAGIQLHEAQGYPRFALEEVHVIEGPTILRFYVLTSAGLGASGQPVANSWPSLESPSLDLPRLPAGADRSAWMQRALIERCDPRGEHEMQIGSGSWIRGDRGPYCVQVISPSTYSDCLEGVGWLGGTNHRGPCEFVFRELLSADDGGGDDGGDTDPSEFEAAVLVELRGIRSVLADFAAHLGVPS